MVHIDLRCCLGINLPYTYSRVNLGHLRLWLVYKYHSSRKLYIVSTHDRDRDNRRYCHQRMELNHNLGHLHIPQDSLDDILELLPLRRNRSQDLHHRIQGDLRHHYDRLVHPVYTKSA